MIVAEKEVRDYLTASKIERFAINRIWAVLTLQVLLCLFIKRVINHI